jgi:KUP system potassium uptake protein
MTKARSLGSVLFIGALGVVFGDIGTSPLYALQFIFGSQGQGIAITPADVYGILSLLIWALILVVSVKFVAFIMRADNEGEGGILALVSLIKGSTLGKNAKWFFVVVGLFGVSLFYGDSVITPAISVLSAVEGLRVLPLGLSVFIVPITVILLAGLFLIQRYGTALIGKFFGPIMLLWFFTIGLAGAWQIGLHPDILQALLPTTAISFFAAHSLIAFIAMAAIVLAITGAEALYADMGHFGRLPIARAWFFVVFPALVLCYLGQGALILHSHHMASNPFIEMFPEVTRLPVTLLATLATLIASQSVISGAFSLTRQAMQLGFLPKLLVRFTSSHTYGQIYIPFINLLMCVVSVALVIAFGSSTRLANAYGIAVAGTLAADTILFMVVMRALWQRSKLYLIVTGLIFIPSDALFLLSSTTKVLHGGLIPVLVGMVVYLLMTTWRAGEYIVDAERQALEVPVQYFIDKIHRRRTPVVRAKGVAVYVGDHVGFAPLALRDIVTELHEMPATAVIVYVTITNTAHVRPNKRAIFDGLRYDDGISSLTLLYGFHDIINIPKALGAARHLSHELDFDLDKAAYFVSLSKLVATKRHNLSAWRKTLYMLMHRNALVVSDYYGLPTARTEEVFTLMKV